jgi:hypothetical protein
MNKCLIQHNFAGYSKLLWITLLKNPWMRAKTLVNQAFYWNACFECKPLDVNKINGLRDVWVHDPSAAKAKPD